MEPGATAEKGVKTDASCQNETASAAIVAAASVEISDEKTEKINDKDKTHVDTGKITFVFLCSL